ncbi:MAG: hypothetical protein ACJ77T_03780 [Gemmatimonadaceae bacterium]
MVFHQIMAAVVDSLLAIPPIRFVMGLVDARWRPLWATIWLAVVAYILSRAMNQLALRRARLHLLRDRGAGEPREANAKPGEPHGQDAGPEPLVVARAPAPPEAPRVPSSPVAARPTRLRIPVPVIAGAVAIGFLAVALTSLVIRDKSRPLADSSLARAIEAAPPPADSALDVRWRSGRMADDDCIGTFEVTQGPGTRAHFVAFVMDTSGAVMARDSVRVASAVRGLLVDFRFRHVDCDEIDDWQLQATTPKAR